MEYPIYTNDEDDNLVGYVLPLNMRLVREICDNNLEMEFEIKDGNKMKLTFGDEELEFNSNNMENIDFFKMTDSGFHQGGVIQKRLAVSNKKVSKEESKRYGRQTIKKNIKYNKLKVLGGGEPVGKQDSKEATRRKRKEKKRKRALGGNVDPFKRTTFLRTKTNTYNEKDDYLDYDQDDNKEEENKEEELDEVSNTIMNFANNLKITSLLSKEIMKCPEFKESHFDGKKITIKSANDYYKLREEFYAKHKIYKLIDELLNDNQKLFKKLVDYYDECKNRTTIAEIVKKKMQDLHRQRASEVEKLVRTYQVLHKKLDLYKKTIIQFVKENK